jgi:flagellum-specific peptidoglycan hydrolase FlgJ
MAVATSPVVRYRVQEGDTVFAIAEKFGVSSETVIWSNKWESSPDDLEVGQELVFPRVSGVLHEVASGDTLEGIAQRYLVDSAAVAAANGLAGSAMLSVGQTLVVPGGRMPMPTLEAQSPAQSSPSVDQETVAQPATAPANTERQAAGVEVRVSLALDPNPAHWAFLKAAVAPAQESQRRTGVPASVTIGQAIHESAWGTSRLSREAHNYFGIKATSEPGPRGVVYMPTWEYLNGKNVTVRAPFRAYNNMTESFVEHGQFFLENNRYARALANAHDPRTFLRLISQAGYATDPAYVRKVLAYMDKYDLYQYDR